MLENPMLGTKKIIPNDIMKNKKTLLESRHLSVKLGQLACSFGKKQIFHFELSSISFHPSDEQKASIYGNSQFRIWLGMPNHTQLKILVYDLSFLWEITPCKKFEDIHWRY